MANPYVIHGIVKLEGVVQDNKAVLVRNDTKSEEATVYTNSAGEYAVDLGDTTKYASGYDDEDNVIVTALTATATAEVDVATFGSRVDLNYVSVLDEVASEESILTHKTLLISDAATTSDSELNHKTLAQLDTGTLADTVLTHKTFAIADEIALAETVSILTGNLVSVTDGVSLSESLGLDKILGVTDLFSLTDSIHVTGPASAVTVTPSSIKPHRPKPPDEFGLVEASAALISIIRHDRHRRNRHRRNRHRRNS